MTPNTLTAPRGLLDEGVHLVDTGAKPISPIDECTLPLHPALLSTELSGKTPYSDSKDSRPSNAIKDRHCELVPGQEVEEVNCNARHLPEIECRISTSSTPDDAKEWRWVESEEWQGSGGISKQDDSRNNEEMAPLQTSSAFPSPVEPSAIDIHHTTSSHWQSSLSTSTKGPGFINTPPFVASPPRPISCSPSGSEQDEIGSRLLVLCSIGKRPGSTPPTPILQTSSAQLYKRWIVYLGKDPDMGLYVHGIFINWQGGAAEYLKEGSKEHLIWRPFENVVIANEYYRECESTGIFKILRRPSNDFTHYIVQEGMHPGVYSSKTDLVTRGLRYRGGIVEVFIGTTLDAEDRYNQLIRQRKISTLSCIDISDDCM